MGLGKVCRVTVKKGELRVRQELSVVLVLDAYVGALPQVGEGVHGGKD